MGLVRLTKADRYSELNDSATSKKRYECVMRVGGRGMDSFVRSVNGMIKQKSVS